MFRIASRITITTYAIVYVSFLAGTADACAELRPADPMEASRLTPDLAPRFPSALIPAAPSPRLLMILEPAFGSSTGVIVFGVGQDGISSNSLRGPR
jgi:hypothetical protein